MSRKDDRRETRQTKDGLSAQRLNGWRLPGWMLVLTLIFFATSAVSQDPTITVIENVRVFDGERVIAKTSVVLTGGVISAVGTDPQVPSSATRIDGSGHTLLPGLIDSHTHAFGPVLIEALNWGVTTELDMFTDWRQAQSLRDGQKDGGAPGRADLFSAGTLITAEGGHGTQFGMPIPTLDRAEDAPAHIAARVEEGSDYIKIVLEDGSTIGREINTLSDDSARAAIAEAQKLGKLAVVHVSTVEKAQLAAAAGANGLVHIYDSGIPDASFVRAAADAGMFVVPTLTVLESVTGGRGGRDMAEDDALTKHLSSSQSSGLRAGFSTGRGVDTDGKRFAGIQKTVKDLKDAGVPILAGTDAPNPGTAHGVSMHRELELLVGAGLTPSEALAAATSVPAKAFGLGTRGRIAVGKKADLLLVMGDPTVDILATRNIAGIWKDGVAFERQTFDPVEAGTAKKIEPSLFTTFDDGEMSGEFGNWIASTDAMAGGKSKLDLKVIEDGVEGSSGALQVQGELVKGFAFPWSGPMFSPGSVPMEAVDISAAQRVTFWARGSGSLRFMLFATSLGQIAAQADVPLTEDWQQHSVTFDSLGVDGSDLMAILFSGSTLGEFSFQLDSIAFAP